MKTEELVKKCQDRMKSIRDKIETKRKSKKVYSEEEVLEFAKWQAENMPIHIIDVENIYVHIENGVIIVEKNKKK